MPSTQMPARPGAGGRRISWMSFEKRLAKALGAMQPDTYLILTTLPGEQDAHYVQFANDADALRAEAGGSAYRKAEEALSPEQEARIRELGWTEPAPDEKGRNPYRSWDVPVPVEDVAALAVETLRSVYGVAAPEDLRYVYRIFTPANGPLKPLPSLGIQPEAERRSDVRTGSAKTVRALRGKVERALAAWLGVPRVVPDGDGDYPIRTGSAICYVRILDGVPPAVSVFSPLLRDVAVTPDLLAALDDINAKIRYGRVFTAGPAVIVAMELPAIDLSVAHVAFVCQELGALADHLDDVLRGRFGGQTAFETTRKLLN